MRSSQSAPACTNPADSFARLPNHHNACVSSCRSTVTSGNECARTHPSIFSHPPVAHKVLSPLKRSRASLTLDPTQSNSSVSWHSLRPIVIAEGNTIPRKFVNLIILTRQREQHAHTQSVSSIGSSCANSSQSPAS